MRQKGSVSKLLEHFRGPEWVWFLPWLLAGFVHGSPNFRSSISLVNTGFVQSLEFLKKSGKNGKKSWVVSKLYNKCFISEFFSLWSNLIQSRRAFAVHREKSFVPAFVKICIDYLFDNLESGKRNNCFGKRSGIVVNFGSKNLPEACK